MAENEKEAFTVQGMENSVKRPSPPSNILPAFEIWTRRGNVRRIQVLHLTIEEAQCLYEDLMRHFDPALMEFLQTRVASG